jgi:hypothetical protein
MLIKASNKDSFLWIFLLSQGVKLLLSLFQPFIIHKRGKVSRPAPRLSLHPNFLGTQVLFDPRATFRGKQFEILIIQPVFETLKNHIPNGINTEHHKLEWTSMPLRGKLLAHLFVPHTRLQSFSLILPLGQQGQFLRQRERGRYSSYE